MAQKTYAGVTVDVNEDGYFTNPLQWTKEIALEIAKEEGLVLTDQHFAIIDFLRNKLFLPEHGRQIS
jgi:tRNA 2-thiouridine synthesizing protein E